MHHVAIMNKSWKLIPKILSGEKSIESRWYQTKRTPWNKINLGDTVFFKNSGEFVTAKATVSKILQFEFSDISEVKEVVEQYGKSICLVNNKPETWGSLPKYCVLVFLCDSEVIKIPFQIDKSGFGTGSAWITVGDISKIKKSSSMLLPSL